MFEMTLGLMRSSSYIKVATVSRSQFIKNHHVEHTLSYSRALEVHRRRWWDR